MPLKKEEMKFYNATYYRDHRNTEKARKREYYAKNKETINSKAREKRRKEREERIRRDRENGVWDF